MSTYSPTMKDRGEAVKRRKGRNPVAASLCRARFAQRRVKDKKKEASARGARLPVRVDGQLRP